METIARTAYHGGIDMLFVALGQHCWGVFDPTSSGVTLHEEAQPGDQDLLDFAAAHTLLNGGTVYAVQPKDMPVDSPVAGIPRYPLNA
jgi:hypothetical protein